MKFIVAACGLPYAEGKFFPEVEPTSTLTESIKRYEWEAGIGFSKFPKPVFQEEVPINDKEAVTVVLQRRKPVAMIKHLRADYVPSDAWIFE